MYQSITSASKFINQTQPQLTDRLKESKLLPKRMIFVYDKTILKDIVKTYGGKSLKLFFGESFTLTKLKKTAVTGNFGIGGPAVGVLLELYIALGIEKFYSIGYAGSISQKVKIGDIIICDGAIPDDGVSQHYLSNINLLSPNQDMIKSLTDSASKCKLTFIIGRVWSIAAPFRETREEIKIMSENNVLAVDMEAATLLAIGQIYNKKIGVIFVISDELSVDNWEIDKRTSKTKEDSVKKAIRIFEN